MIICKKCGKIIIRQTKTDGGKPVFITCQHCSLAQQIVNYQKILRKCRHVPAYCNGRKFD